MNTTLHRMYLIGGGWSEEAFAETYGPFVRAATGDTGRKIALVIALDDESDRGDVEAKFRSPFESLSVAHDEIAAIFVSKDHPLTLETLTAIDPTGVFVCGGTTPLYQEALCRDTGWLGYVIAEQLPYGGFSAGSSIAAQRAVVGGWRIPVGASETPIVDEEVSEGLDLVTVRDGLGLLPLSIDVHCGQWSTITRLIHAVNAGMIEVGLGIDEDTMLEVENGVRSVRGLGHVYRVQSDGAARVTVEIFVTGDIIDP